MEATAEGGSSLNIFSEVLSLLPPLPVLSVYCITACILISLSQLREIEVGLCHYSHYNLIIRYTTPHDLTHLLSNFFIPIGLIQGPSGTSRQWV